MSYAKAKLAALFLIGFLAGLGGFVISYLFHQHQISSLTCEVAILRTELNELESKLNSSKSIISNSTSQPQTHNITDIASQIEGLQCRFEILRNALLNLTGIMENFNYVLNIILTSHALSSSERLDFMSAQTVNNGFEFMINITVRNVGQSPVIITAIFFNDVSYSNIDGISISPDPSTNILVINTDSQQTFIIRMPINIKIDSAIVAPGVSLDITIQTLTGNRYNKTINLP
ncbi:MAG: hypothetical protein RMK50_06310 [Nitrososphaerota archaeon]|nr:hypothetical protein [Candidatus Bathyarchaeota archaeon]MDW8194415.1 hypothetical protein [Nitrososphaerota archaeon]